MTVITRDSDVAKTALLRWSPQFYNEDDTKPALILKQNLESLVRVFTDELQELEDAIIGVMYELDLTKATGSSLDVIAAVVGAIERNGLSDDDYRAEIELQVAINTSKGTIPGIIDAIKRITKSNIVEWLEGNEWPIPQPAAISFVVNGSVANQQVLDRITMLLGAGVGFDIAYRDDNVGVFNFSEQSGVTNIKFPDNYRWRAFSDVYPASVVNGSASVTISATHNNLAGVGSILYFDGNLQEPYEIQSIGGTTITLTNTYSGTTNSNAVLYIERNQHETIGTVAVTNGSANVVLSNPAADFNNIHIGDALFFAGSSTGYTVQSLTSPNITLTTNYGGVTNATASCTVMQHSGSFTDLLTFV